MRHNKIHCLVLVVRAGFGFSIYKPNSNNRKDKRKFIQNDGYKAAYYGTQKSPYGTQTKWGRA